MKGNKIYGDLSYANISPSYVGLPTSELDSLGQKLEKDYNDALDTRDKLQMAASSISVRDPNYSIIKNAISKIDNDLKGYSQRGDWEKAGLTLRNTAKEFATDPLIRGAIQDKQRYDAWSKELQDNDKILDSDKQYAITKSMLENQGALEYDPETGTYKNMFSGSSAPEFVDVNKKIQDVIKDMNPSTRAILLQRAQQMGYLMHGKIEELTPQQLREVAKDMIMGDESVKSYVNFQAEKQNFYNKLTRDENGNLVQRDYTPQDLMKMGILSPDNKAYVPKLDDKNRPVYKNKDGQEFSYNQVVRDAQGNIYATNKKGKATELVTPVMVENSELINGVTDEAGNIIMPGLFNSDGSFNSDVAENIIKQNIKSNQFNNYLDYADNFAYSKEDIDYKEDWITKQNRQFAHDKAMKDYEYQLNNQDFYVNTIMNTEDGQVKTLDPTAAKALFNDGTADFKNLILDFAKTSIGQLTPQEQRLIPYATKLKELINISNPGIMRSLQAVLRNKFSLDQQGTKNLDKEVLNAKDQIKSIVESTGVSEKELLQYLEKYEKLGDKEKSALNTLGKIMQLPQAPVALQNKDNLKNVDGTIQIGVNGTFSLDQLNGIEQKDIDNLNEVFGKNILSTKMEGTGENAKPVYQISGFLEHTPSYEAQQKYNSNYGTSKYTEYHRQTFNNQVNANSDRKLKKYLLNSGANFTQEASQLFEGKDLSKILIIQQGQQRTAKDLYNDIINNSKTGNKSEWIDDLIELKNYVNSIN